MRSIYNVAYNLSSLVSNREIYEPCVRGSFDGYLLCYKRHERGMAMVPWDD